jgi:hypothetical protein
VHTEFLYKNLGECLEVDRRIILKWKFRKKDGRLRVEFIWLRMGTSGGFLSTLL